MGLNDAGALDTCLIEFKLDYTKNQSLAAGKAVYRHISAGGLTWTIGWYPHGSLEDTSGNGEYLSLLAGKTKGSIVLKAIFHASVMGRDGIPSYRSSLLTYPSDGTKSSVTGGWHKYMRRSELESNYLVDGCVTFICGITVLPGDGCISVPASDLASHLGNMLDCADGYDVSFSVGGETFRAHRSVLAARSPVFKAQLLGSMADASLSCITLHDIQPAAFQALLRFMYTDALPAGDEELDGSSVTELLQHLLAAADMYHLDRLKLMCAQKLFDRVSVENVATMLGCAEAHNCPELKYKCMDFFMVGKNFKRAAFTEGYLRLMQGFPFIISEIKGRLKA